MKYEHGLIDLAKCLVAAGMCTSQNISIKHLYRNNGGLCHEAHLALASVCGLPMTLAFDGHWLWVACGRSFSKGFQGCVVDSGPGTGFDATEVTTGERMALRHRGVHMCCLPVGALVEPDHMVLQPYAGHGLDLFHPALRSSPPQALGVALVHLLCSPRCSLKSRVKSGCFLPTLGIFMFTVSSD